MTRDIWTTDGYKTTSGSKYNTNICFCVWTSVCGDICDYAESTVRYWYNAANFLQYPHNRHPITRPWGMTVVSLKLDLRSVAIIRLYRHYCDVIMGTVAFLITSLTSVYSTVHSGADQRKHQSSASLAFVRGIHRRPVNSPHKWPVTRKMFQFDDVIMVTNWTTL